MEFNKQLELIRRTTYRMRVTQAGGKFITVVDGNALAVEEQLERKAKYDKYIYNRDNGYSGFDEYPDKEWDHE